MKLYTVENLTLGAVLADRLRVAGSSAERRTGLLGTQSLDAGEALWIAPCEAIHTLGMRWPIDVVFLDKRYRVVKVNLGLPPWRVSFCLRASSVVELPAGVVGSTRTAVGHLLSFQPTLNFPPPSTDSLADCPPPSKSSSS